jgi:hypothetical protein
VSHRYASDYPIWWALPGGFVEPHEDLREAAERELPPAHARVVSVAWLAVLPELVAAQAGSDAVARFEAADVR